MGDIQKVEGKIGSVGIWSQSISDKGVVNITVGVAIDLVAEAKKLAAKTSTPIDDQAIAWLESLMGKQ